VGVIQVFEEESIPVDLVAGTSMGSIVALGCASGISGAEMSEIAARIGTVRTTLGALDFTLTRPGLLAGDRLIATFLPLMPVSDFTDLVIPCRTVATDIESGECVPIVSGRLDMAFRASCSVPVIWSPVRYLDRVLVDGAMVNPVPVDVARAMGADVCIAINVVPSLKRGVDTALARAYRLLNRFNPLSYVGAGRGLPSLFDVTMNSIQQLQHELGAFKAISADVRITPDLSDFTWIEFYRPQELIERGAEAARKALPEIRRVLAERLEVA
jgi:NTE family protein